MKCSLMYEKNGKVFTSKSVGTGPSSYEKRIYRAAVSQRLRNTGLRHIRAAGTQLHTFSTSAQEEGQWSTSQTGRITQEYIAPVTHIIRGCLRLRGINSFSTA